MWKNRRENEDLPNSANTLRVTACTLASAICISFGGPALAQMEISDDVNPGFKEFEESLLPQLEQLPVDEAVDVEPELINGTVVDPRYFPAVFGKKLAFRPNPVCTASLVGPATILIAAHCVDDNPNIRLSNGQKFANGRCVISPHWRGEQDTGVDIAVCILDRRITGIAYETLSFKLPSVDETVYPVGYGCTEENGPTDGRLRLGSAPISNRPEGFPRAPGTLYTKAIDGRDAILCPGDSGAPVYAINGGLNGARSQLGVASASYSNVSLFAALGYQKNKEFIEDIVARSSGEVCGINLELGCRTGV